MIVVASGPYLPFFSLPIREILYQLPAVASDQAVSCRSAEATPPALGSSPTHAARGPWAVDWARTRLHFTDDDGGASRLDLSGF